MIEWSDGLTEKERKAVYTMWESYYPYAPLAPQVNTVITDIILRRLSQANPDLQAIGRKLVRNLAGIVAELEKDPTITTQSQGESSTMSDKPKTAPAATAPTAATPKKLSPEEQAKLDAEINSNLGKKPKATKESTPRSGAAPGGKTWVEWFREVIGVQGTRSDEDFAKVQKDAEAKYIELRKGEPAYSDEGGDKKLKRHAYHHRVLAMEQKPAA